MTASGSEAQLADIKKMMADKNFAGARAAVDGLLALEPDNPDALYLSAVCYRYAGEFQQAQEPLDALQSTDYDKSRVYQEQGHLHLARGAPEKALAAYANACQLNPALIASWRNQHKILTAIRRPVEARQAQAQVHRLQNMPRPLVAVMDLLSQGKLRKAEELCRKFLKANPTHTEAMRLLAEIATGFGELGDAEYLLESATEFAPDNIQIRIDYIGVLRQRQKFPEALVVAEALFSEHPENPQIESLYAVEKMQSGDYDGAIAMFDNILRKLPGDAVTLTSRGHALKTRGDQQAAIESYRAAIAHNPWHGDAYYSLSNLKTYRFDDEQVAEMLALEQREELSPVSRVHLDFALGKAFEDGRDYARAFEFYSKGNQLKRQQSNYSAERMSEELAAQRKYFTEKVLTSRGTPGFPAPDPIFIVGLPRAGSTLLEQILSSHSQVDGTLELPNILATAQTLKRRGRDDAAKQYPELLTELSDTELSSLGKRYMEETRIHRQSAPFFIDKMPNNFRHVGLIKLILPNARIIDARRHPMACCFSGFKQLFAEGQEFSYNLVDIGRYYNDYVALMDHWEAVAPGSVLRVHYENVVQDLEGQVNRILEFCGLPFEQACMDFHRTERAVRTASSEQVRQPIYGGGVGQWEHFRTYLTELEETVASSIARYEKDLLEE